MHFNIDDFDKKTQAHNEIKERLFIFMSFNINRRLLIPFVIIRKFKRTRSNRRSIINIFDAFENLNILIIINNLHDFSRIYRIIIHQEFLMIIQISNDDVYFQSFKKLLLY